MAQGLFGTNTALGQVRQTALQPAGIPGSTFVRPEQRQTGGNLQALAQALGGLNTALSNYATVQAQEEKDPNSIANQEWIARAQQMDATQLAEVARSGGADGNRVRTDALNTLLGDRAYADMRVEWLDFYNTDFDQTTGNAAAEYERMRQEYAAALPNEISRGNFYRLTNDHMSSWLEQDMKVKAQYEREMINTTVLDSFRAANEDMSVKGLPAADRAKAIFVASASNRTFLGMSGAEQNETIFNLAKEFALKGDEDMVRELLMGTRVGADGETLPSLSSISRYATDALTLVEQAGGVRDRKIQEDGFTTFSTVNGLIAEGKFTEAEAANYRGTGYYTDEELAAKVQQSTNVRVQAEKQFIADQSRRQAREASALAEQRVYTDAFTTMLNVGGLAAIKDMDIPNTEGTGTKKVTRSEILKEATNIFERQLAAQATQAEAQGQSPEAIAQSQFSTRLNWYATNQIDNPEWSTALNGIASFGTIENLLERGNISAEIGEQAELYRQLQAANPAYLSTILTDSKSKLFLSAYDNAVTNRRMPTEGALHYAAQLVAAPDNVKVNSMLTADKSRQIAERVLRDLGMEADRSTNFATVLQQITDASVAGITEGGMYDYIRAQVEDTSVPIHGMLVPDHRDLPKDFPELMEIELQSAFEVFGERYGITDVNDLYVVPVSGQSKWQVVSKSLGGMPLGTSYITPQSLQVQRSKRDRAHDALVLQMVQQADADKAANQARYDAFIAEQRASIESWRNRTGKLSPFIADYMQGVLDDRLARDEYLRNLTPEKWAEEQRAIDEALQEQAANATFAVYQ